MSDYIENYEIIIPRLKRKDEWTGKLYNLPINDSLGDWTYDFESAILQRFGLHKVSFCFFIMWKPKELHGILHQMIWLKRELSIHDSSKKIFEEKLLAQKLLSLEQEQNRKLNARFFTTHALQPYYILLKDITGRTTIPEDERIAIEAIVNNNGRLLSTSYTYADFKKILIERSNRPIIIGAKGLKLAETELERYIASQNKQTGALFPGDCDMLLYDNDCKCKVIIEFKKVGINGQYSVADESFLHYYEDQIVNGEKKKSGDKSKYRRLNLLRKHFELCEGRWIPLANVFYPVGRENENNIKIEFVEEGNQDLVSGKSAVITMKDSPQENQFALIAKILDMMQLG